MGNADQLPPLPDMSRLHSLEAEQCILGSLMVDNSAWDRIADLVVEGSFYLYSHRLIFRALQTLLENNKPADVITVMETLRSRDELEKAEGFVYLDGLSQTMPSSANIRMYAEIVRDRALLRKMYGALTKGIDRLFARGDTPVTQLVDEIQAAIMGVSVSGAAKFGGLNHVHGAVERVMNQLDALSTRPEGSVSGITTGFGDLDSRTDGMHAGDLIILAARPAMGKTAMLCNIAEHVSLDVKLPVAVFTMEMSEEQLAMRLLASLTNVNSQRLRVGRLNNAEWDKISGGVGRLSGAPIYMDEQGNLTAGTIRSHCRKLAREHGGQLGLIAIDYVQLMRGEHSRGGGAESRAAEISEISRGLKALAKELKCPVLLLSQLNRGVESRPNKRPMMSDLRESGGLEQDADTILMLYRDEYYNPDSPDKGTAEVIITKQRNGPVGTVRLGYRGDNTRFHNIV